MLYMCVRLIINVTQVYIPMYTLETLGLSKVCVRVSSRGLEQPVPISSLISLPLSLTACVMWRWSEILVNRRDWQTISSYNRLLIKLARALSGCCISNSIIHFFHHLLARVLSLKVSKTYSLTTQN